MVVKNKLTPVACNWLIRPVSAKEVKRAFFQFNPDKAPGVDGFNAYFFQKQWSIAGKQTTLAVQSFFQNSKLLNELNHTLLTLITNNASSLSDYRPISCCNQL